MLKRRSGSKEAKVSLVDATQLVGEAIEVTRETLEVGAELLDTAERATDMAVDALAVARERTAYAAGVIALAKAVGERVGVERATEVLSGDELQAFAEAVPQWSVSTGFTNGNALKTYKRIISAEELPPERSKGGAREHETYLSLADYEHSDLGLASIFDTYGFMGDYVNGRWYEISFSSMEQGPITYADFARVLDAESYLIAEGYVVPLELPASEERQDADTYFA